MLGPGGFGPKPGIKPGLAQRPKQRWLLRLAWRKKRSVRTVEPHSVGQTLRWGSALHPVLEELAGGEGGNALGRDLDLVASLGVEALAG